MNLTLIRAEFNRDRKLAAEVASSACRQRMRATADASDRRVITVHAGCSHAGPVEQYSEVRDWHAPKRHIRSQRHTSGDTHMHCEAAARPSHRLQVEGGVWSSDGFLYNTGSPDVSAAHIPAQRTPTRDRARWGGWRTPRARVLAAGAASLRPSPGRRERDRRSSAG